MRHLGWMANTLVSDDLWTLVEPLLPPVAPKPQGGRPRVSNRAALTGILFVLRTGLSWPLLPAEMGCGSGVTCWRRLRDWQQAGVWDRLHRVLLSKLQGAGRIDWSRACMDSVSVAAKRGARRPGPIRPTGEGRAASATSSPTAPACRSPSC